RTPRTPRPAEQGPTASKRPTPRAPPGRGERDWKQRAQASLQERVCSRARALCRRQGSSRCRGQIAWERVCVLGDISGAQADDDIAGPRLGANKRGEIIEACDTPRVTVAVALQTGGERIGAHAIYWRFAGRIDIGDGHDIGIVE